MEGRVLLALLVLSLAVLPTCRAAYGTVIPLYIGPADSSWTVVAKGKAAHPTVTVVAVIKPGSNGPGTEKDPAYDNGIKALRSAGVLVLGYVLTDSGKRAPADVQKDINNYKTWYSEISGIYLAEMSSTAGEEAYYAGINKTTKASSANLKVMGDPMTDTQSLTYVGTVDVIALHDGPGLPVFRTSDPHDTFPQSGWASISYSVSTLDANAVQQVLKHVFYFYATTSSIQDKFSLPTYFDSMLKLLE